uniref:Cytochrome P450 n=1 Tax=Timema shepardi TaxID=629360 RepID=A0A7R9AXA2_TIMSH|nr:unnamed protein product [Timema shepardi]
MTWPLGVTNPAYGIGPPCFPFIGSLLSMPTHDIHLSMMTWQHTYGSLTGFMMGGQPMVAVCEPKAVQEVLRREEFQGRPDMFIFKERSFNKKLGVFFSDGHFWVEQRRFTLRHLREFGFGKKSMESVMHQEVDELSAHLKSSEITEVFGLFNIPVLNVLWCIMAGKRFSHDDKEFKDILERLFEAFRSGNPSGGIINMIPALRHIMPKSSGYSIIKETNTSSQQLLKNASNCLDVVTIRMDLRVDVSKTKVIVCDMAGSVNDCQLSMNGKMLEQVNI